jgi:hypothetical protein
MPADSFLSKAIEELRADARSPSIEDVFDA